MDIIQDATDFDQLRSWADFYLADRADAIERIRTQPDFQAWMENVLRSDNTLWTEDDCARKWVDDRDLDLPNLLLEVPSWADSDRTKIYAMDAPELAVTFYGEVEIDAAHRAVVAETHFIRAESTSTERMVTMLGFEERFVVFADQIPDVVAGLARVAEAIAD